MRAEKPKIIPNSERDISTKKENLVGKPILNSDKSQVQSNDMAVTDES